MELTIEKVRDLKPKIEFARDILQITIDSKMNSQQAIIVLDKLLETLRAFENKQKDVLVQLLLELGDWKT